jgi:hypothetical protein
MSFVDYLWVKLIVLFVLAICYGAWREYVKGKPPKQERLDKQ